MLRHGGLWLQAVRNGFISLLPLTFFRVIAQLFQQLPWDAYQNWMTSLLGTNWSAYLGLIIAATNNVFGIALAVLVAFHLAELLPASKNTEDLPVFTVGMAALINFVILAYIYPLSAESFGVNAILLAVTVGVITSELLRWVMRYPRLSIINMPYDTEETFFHAMRATLPVMLVGGITFLFSQFIAGIVPHQTDLSSSLVAWSHTIGHGVWWLSAAAALINQAFWYIGFHGGLIIDAYFSGLFFPTNIPYGADKAWRPLLDNCALLGGAGATLGLLVAIAIAARNGTQRNIAKLSALPSLFNINDILLYGLPIVLNPLYLIPFILVPLALMLISVAAAQTGFVIFHPAHVTWITPPFISGWLLTGSWRGVFLQAVCLAVSTILYLPFVRRAEAERLRQQSIVFTKVKDFLLAEDRARLPAINMQGQIGIISRGLLSDLQKSLKNKELNLAYQPKHDHKGRVIGVEALLRWENSRYGNLPALVGVTLAEDSGDIHALGAWVLDEACACKARWNKLGYKSLTMAINVSPIQLSSPNLSIYLIESLHKHGLEPHEIELEITESSVIPDTHEVDRTLQELADTGVRLAMDDFGMGYSSLLYMRRIDVHAIKIDGSLTRDVLTNSTNADIIRTIAALGHSQKVDVVAEFVESKEQQALLIELGCNLFQGYLHSPPMAENLCVDYFKQHTAEPKTKRKSIG